MIGAIADDFTGATDVALAFRDEGLRTQLYFGVPSETRLGAEEPDAVVIALKTRTAPHATAVAQSLAALGWLLEQGVQQVYFKYCSTFDSTPQGNIGPVLDALSTALGADSVLTTPSSPEHGRTQYLGYLFVNDLPLAESHMALHPVNPMIDSSLRRLLTEQTARPVGLIPWAVVSEGADAIRRRRETEAVNGTRYLLVDAINDPDLRAVGMAARHDPLVSGAAGLARALARANTAETPGRAGLLPTAELPEAALTGRAAILSGSCSTRTLMQIGVLRERDHPVYQLDPLLDGDPESMAADSLAWFDALPPETRAPVFYSSLDPAGLERVRLALGMERPAAILEEASGRIASGLVARGFTRIITAGGETAGAVVSALGMTRGEIGPEVAAGVPWIISSDGTLAMLLKSGNFGAPELLADVTADRTWAGRST